MTVPFNLMVFITFYTLTDGVGADRECAVGWFVIDNDCTGECRCAVAKTCRASDGRCMSGGCRRGWKGKSCQTPCEPGRFWRNCVGHCRCKNDVSCDSVTGECPNGCASGYSGPSCDIEAPSMWREEDSTSDIEDYTVIGLWVGGGVFVLLIVVTVATALVIKRRDIARLWGVNQQSNRLQTGADYSVDEKRRPLSKSTRQLEKNETANNGESSRAFRYEYELSPSISDESLRRDSFAGTPHSLSPTNRLSENMRRFLEKCELSRARRQAETYESAKRLLESTTKTQCQIAETKI